MKRMKKELFLFMLALMVPFSLAFGQEKKAEQKIKVVINDGSGEKTVIDTLFTGGTLPETITLKDGKIIILEKPDGKSKQIFVTVTSDGNCEKKKERKVIIMSSDSVLLMTSESPDKKKYVYHYSTEESTGDKPGTKVVVVSGGDEGFKWEGKEDGKVIVIDSDIDIDSDLEIDNEDNKTLTIMIESDDNDTDTDVTKYVIAKDGFVVTVEGNDEEKAKEIIELVKSKLGVKNEDEKNVVVKTETKKSVKK